MEDTFGAHSSSKEGVADTSEPAFAEMASSGIKRKAEEQETNPNLRTSHQAPHSSKRANDSPSPSPASPVEKQLTINWACSPEDASGVTETPAAAEAVEEKEKEKEKEKEEMGKIEEKTGTGEDEEDKDDASEANEDAGAEDEVPILLLTPQQLHARMLRDEKVYSYITGAELLIQMLPGQQPIDKLLECVPPPLETDPPVTKESIRTMSMAPIVGVQNYPAEAIAFRNNFAQTFAFGPAQPGEKARPWIPQAPPLANNLLEPVYMLTPKSQAISLESVRSICAKILPSSAVLSLHAMEILQTACIEFTSLVSSEAGLYSLADVSNRTGPGSVLGADIVSALEALGFTDYATFAKEFLAKFQAQQQLFRRAK